MADVASETAALLQRDAEFAAAASEGRDVEKVVSFWSADAVVMPPGQPTVVGRDALRKYVEDSYRIPGFNITWDAATDPQFSSDGDLAYMSNKLKVTLNDADGNPTTTHSRSVMVWRREADGVWRCIVDIWNDEPPS